MSNKIWLEIVEYARWSPSVHNIQPWKLRIISEHDANLYYDSKRLIPATDPTSSLTILSLSMFIECLSIAANTLGYFVKHELIMQIENEESKKKYTHYARLFLVKTSKIETFKRELILKRKTSRLNYNGQKLESYTIQNLTKYAENFKQSLHFSNDELTKSIIKLNTKTFFHELSNTSALKEFSNWMRTSESEAQEKKDGLSNKCLALSPILLKTIVKKPMIFQSRFLKPLVSFSYNSSMSKTPCISWISGKLENKNDWMNAGKFLMRFWLLLTQENISIHPLMSISFNQSIFDEFKKMVKFDDKSKEVWFIFRIGYSKDAPQSYRLETKDILIDENED